MPVLPVRNATLIATASLLLLAACGGQPFEERDRRGGSSGETSSGPTGGGQTTSSSTTGSGAGGNTSAASSSGQGGSATSGGQGGSATSSGQGGSATSSGQGGGATGAGGGASTTAGSGGSGSGLNLPTPLDNYASLSLPAHFLVPEVQALDNTPQNNPVTDAGATLGRVLFYDVELSQNSAVSCATCHRQDLGFSDADALSEGFDQGLTGRNTMNLTNARYYASGRFFWDERAASLEEQVLMPIQNAVEMGLTLPELITRVEAQDYYPALFTAAFGDSVVTTDRIAAALAQFVRAMVSYQTPFDAGIALAGSPMPPFPNLTPEENAGKGLFFGPAGCAACHVANPPPPPPPAPPPMLANQAAFVMAAPANNGLDIATVADGGVGDQTGNPQDDGKFKSPSLRNIALSAPYMHDGRFNTLAEVVDFYDHGVQAHPNLDPRLRVPGTNTPRTLQLTAAEKDSLVAFLGTLTDIALITDPKFADPFVAP